MTNLEALLIGIVVILLGAILLLLRLADGILAEARKLRANAIETEASAQVHARLLDVTPTLIAALDGMHRYLSVNQAFEETVGISRSRLIGVKAGSFPGLAGSLGAQLEMFAAQCIAGDKAITEMVNIAPAKGRSFNGLLIVKPLNVGKSSPSGALAAIVDVTDRVNAEREAREIKDAVEDLVATLPMAFFRLREDVDGHRWFPYYVGHPERFLRIPVSDQRGKSGRITLPNILETHLPAAHSAISASRDHGTSIQIDLEVHRPTDDGWLRVGTAVPHRLPDGSLEWNGYLIDVTQEHRDKLALSRAKAATEADAQAKARLLATMSHEIRMPLATAVGALELLRDSSLDPVQSQHVDLANSASRMLMDIIGDILDISRLDAGELGLDAVPFSLRELLDQVLHIFSTNARFKGLTLDLRVAHDVAEEFVGDPMRIKQIVLNLVDNAIKFTSRGGITVSVDIGEEAPSENSTQQVLFITVADTGIGISDDTQRRLFEPFVQADTSTARQYGGSGLGLAICLRLARLLGGDIRLDSKQGHGSVFEVSLPLHVSRAAQPDPLIAGRRLSISARRTQDHACLQEYARTLGFKLVPAIDDADLCITDTPVMTAADTPPVIVLIDPLLTRSLNPPSAASLPCGPIRWTEFKEHCLIALQSPHFVAKTSTSLPDNPPPLAARRVLVVEDHVPHQIVVRNLLEKLGLEVDVIADGSTALHMLKQSRYDLVITDCRLPGMDGLELTRRIRAMVDINVRDLPVLALSADVFPDHLQHYTEAGINDFLVKPVTLSTLRQYVEKWTDAAV